MVELTKERAARGDRKRGNAGERSAVGPPEAARAGMERKDFGKAGAKYSAQVHHTKTGRRKAFPSLCGGIDERARSAWGQEAGNAGERSAVGPPGCGTSPIPQR